MKTKPSVSHSLTVSVFAITQHHLEDHKVGRYPINECRHSWSTRVEFQEFHFPATGYLAA